MRLQSQDDQDSEGRVEDEVHHPAAQVGAGPRLFVGDQALMSPQQYSLTRTRS